MGLFEQFPYTNFHELNLDWLLQEVKKLYDSQQTLDQKMQALEEFVTNYFEELDIPAEIRDEVINVFNEMMLSGDFALALAQFYNFIATPEICGAIGDGVTDDTAAFETLAGIPRIYIPNKSYNITKPVMFSADQVLGNDGTYTNKTALAPFNPVKTWNGRIHAFTRTITGCQGADYDTRRDKLLLGYVGGIYRMDFDGFSNLETFVVPEVEHANDLAYVYDTDRIYVAQVDTAGVITALNASDMSVAETVSLPIGGVVSISYDPVRNLFYVIADNSIYTYTYDFTLLNTAPFTAAAGAALWPNSNPYTAQQGSFYADDVLYRVVSVFDPGPIAISCRLVALDIKTGDLIGTSDFKPYSYGEEAEGAFYAVGTPYLVSYTGDPAGVYIRELIDSDGYIERACTATVPNALHLYVDETQAKCGSGLDASDPINDLQIAIDRAAAHRRTNIYFLADTVKTGNVSLADFNGTIILEGGANNEQRTCSRRINLNRVNGFYIGPHMLMHHDSVCVEFSHSIGACYNGATFTQNYSGGAVDTGKQALRLIGGSRVSCEGVTFKNCHIALRAGGGCIVIADSYGGSGNGVGIAVYRGASISNNAPTATTQYTNDNGFISIGSQTLI